MKYLVLIAIASLTTACTLNTPNGQYTLGSSEIDHNVSVTPIEQPQQDPEATETGIRAILEYAPSNGRIPLLDKADGRPIGYGLNDDVVDVLGSIPGWYHVQFPQSKAIGWIHQDYVRRVN